MDRIAYLDGAFLPLSEARISPLDRGFLFADGIYEVTAVLGGRLVDNASHLARLRRCLGEIGIALPVTAEELVGLEREIVRRNGLDEGVVYMQVTRGAADRDFVFPQAARPTFFMFTQRKAILASPAAETGIRVKSVPDLRWARRDIKSVALLAQVLAKQAAKDAGCQEAWMVEDGFVTEGASSSAFIVAGGGALVTRPNSEAVLPGCTRRALMALAAERGIPVELRPFTVAEALGAREAFATSASTFVLPVVAIDGAPVGDGTPGPLARRLRELYTAFARDTAI